LPENVQAPEKSEMRYYSRPIACDNEQMVMIILEILKTIKMVQYSACIVAIRLE